MDVVIHTKRELTPEQVERLITAVHANMDGDYDTRFAIQRSLRERFGLLIAAMGPSEVYVSFQESERRS